MQNAGSRRLTGTLFTNPVSGEENFMDVSEGQRVTTRYFGGYESVKVVQVHDTYCIVSRFGGQVTDVLPKDQVAKAFDAAGLEVFRSESEDGLHPALRNSSAPVSR
jgi:hypothetical protein